MDSSTDLMYSLPDLLWSKVLKNVSSQDALNVCQEYPHISNAVHPYKAQLLFGKVVPFLACWKCPSRSCKCGLLNLPDLRSCRLVCKNWCREIDRIFQTMEHNLVDPARSWQSDLKLFNSHYEWDSGLDIKFTSLSDFTKFTKQFETLAGNRNPFPSRTFELDIFARQEWDPEEGIKLYKREENPEAAKSQYWTLLINFLEKFGTHIEHFDFATGMDFQNAQDLNGIIELKNLAKCLRLLPNLKSFTLCTLWDKWIFNSLTELESTMASEFVDMPKLEIANISFKPDEPELFNSFLNVFSQSIKRLVLPPVIYSDTLPSMPALVQICTNDPCAEDMEYLNSLAKVAPNLQKVTLGFGPFGDYKPDVIRALENFPNRENFKLESDSKTLCLILQIDK